MFRPIRRPSQQTMAQIKRMAILRSSCKKNDVKKTKNVARELCRAVCRCRHQLPENCSRYCPKIAKLYSSLSNPIINPRNTNSSPNEPCGPYTFIEKKKKTTAKNDDAVKLLCRNMCGGVSRSSLPVSHQYYRKYKIVGRFSDFSSSFFSRFTRFQRLGWRRTWVGIQKWTGRKQVELVECRGSIVAFKA